MKSALVGFMIFFLLLLIWGFYYVTLPQENNAIRNNNISNSKTCDDINKNKKRFAILSNYGDNQIELRIMNIIIYKGQYYTYSNKNSYHVKQLSVNNKVSLLIYSQEDKIDKQTLLYGYLDVVKEFEDMILYKLEIENRKISITRETISNQITNYSYDNKDDKELKIGIDNIDEIINYIKEQ